MIGKIFAIVLSALGILTGGVSFIFNAAKSDFDLFGRIGFGGMLIILAIVIFYETLRRRENLPFCNGEGCTEKISGTLFCKHCNIVAEQDNNEPIGVGR